MFEHPSRHIAMLRLSLFATIAGSAAENTISLTAEDFAGNIGTGTIAARGVPVEGIIMSGAQTATNTTTAVISTRQEPQRRAAHE
jgi:hypothetical protein